MPSLCTVSGNLTTLSGGALANGQVILELSNVGIGNPAMILGTSILPAWKYVIPTAPDGSFTQGIWGNDNINPSNTIYNVTFRDFEGNEIGPIQYSITGSSADLNTLASITATIPPVLNPGGGGGSSMLNISSKSTNFAANAISTLYLVTTGSSTITGTLLTAVGIAGNTVYFKKVDSGSGSVTVATTSAQTIDGLSTYQLVNQWQFVGVISDGSNWQVIDNN